MQRLTGSATRNLGGVNSHAGKYSSSSGTLEFLMPPAGLATGGFRCCSGRGVLPSAEPTLSEHDSVFRWLREVPL